MISKAEKETRESVLAHKIEKILKESGQDTIACEKCCLYPPANLPRGKTFLTSEWRESNLFYYRNHATHRIRDWIFYSCFRVVSSSTTSTTYKPLSVLRFRSTFSIFFFPELTEIFHKTPWKTGHSLPSIAHVYLWWWNVIPLRTRCRIQSM